MAPIASIAPRSMRPQQLTMNMAFCFLRVTGYSVDVCVVDFIQDKASWLVTAGAAGYSEISELASLNTSKEKKMSVSTFNDSVSEILTAFFIIMHILADKEVGKKDLILCRELISYIR